MTRSEPVPPLRGRCWLTSLVQLEAAQRRLRVQWVPTGVATNPVAPLGSPEVEGALDVVGGRLQVGVLAGVDS